MAAPGDRLADRYELVAPIGAGGMATVWRAYDTRLQRQVAVKLLRPQYGEDEEFVRRFEAEARHAASLSHPNIATVFDTGTGDGTPFIVMELADGPTVADLLRDRGTLPPPIAIEIAAAAARALAAAHRRGLIHRDVKPANLLLARDGTVRLADFGIARALTTSRATAPGTVLGSIPYLSPEQARGEEATAAGDIFSLGVVLFEMLTGRLPWSADTPAALATVRLTAPPVPPSAVKADLPPGIDAVVERALDLDAAVRYPSARAFAETLETWLRRFAAIAPEATPDLADTIAMAAAAAALAGDAGEPDAPRRPEEEEPRVVASAVAAMNAVPDTRVPLPALATAAAIGAGAALPPPGARPPTARYRRSPTRPPAPPPAVSQDRERDDDDRRRGRFAALAGIGATALLVVVGVAALMSSGPRGDVLQATGRPGAVGGAEATGSPSPAVVIVVPSPSPSPTPLPTIAPTVSPPPSPVPTTRPTTRPTPEPTPDPTPRPRRSPSPTPPPTPRPQPATATAAARAVSEFYGAVERHDWDRAIALWSPSMQQRYPPDEWLIGRFRRTTDIEITRLETLSIDRDAGTARVAVSIIERRSREPALRRFTGAWDLVRIDGAWLLDDPDF